jgi:hypothetical protein
MLTLLRLSRRQVLKSLLGMVAWLSAAVPQRSSAQTEEAYTIDVNKPLIPSPDSSVLWPVCRRQLAEWRAQAHRSLGYRDVRYRDESVEWTESERTDGRTRFCLIRGGSYYLAQGSHWYMDGGPQPADCAAKFLRMWPGLDRCATIGVRCVARVE